MTKLNRSLSCLSLLLVCGLFGTGCRSMSGPGSSSFASVVIPHRSAAEVQAATQQVFGENGYWRGASGPGQMVFETEGSRANTLARDGLAAAQAGARTLVRVRVDLEGLGDGSHRLECQAFMVSGAGDSFFEEEHRLTNIRSRPYQKLLNEVAKRLKQL
jgi:hypothetical protein